MHIHGLVNDNDSVLLKPLKYIKSELLTYIIYLLLPTQKSKITNPPVHPAKSVLCFGGS